MKKVLEAGEDVTVRIAGENLASNAQLYLRWFRQVYLATKLISGVERF